MAFEQEKNIFLHKKDKSRKKEIDSRVISLVNKINSHPNYYTTSSCSGRITAFGVRGSFEAKLSFSKAL